MKVIMLDTKKTVEVNDSYGARLVEQGKAILPESVAEKTVVPEEQKEEKAKANKNGKG